MKQMTVTLSVPDVMKEMKASIADNFMKPCWIIGSYTEPLGRFGHNATVGGVGPWRWTRATSRPR